MNVWCYDCTMFKQITLIYTFNSLGASLICTITTSISVFFDVPLKRLILVRFSMFSISLLNDYACLASLLPLSSLTREGESIPGFYASGISYSIRIWKSFSMSFHNKRVRSQRENHKSTMILIFAIPCLPWQTVLEGFLIFL